MKKGAGILLTVCLMAICTVPIVQADTGYNDKPDFSLSPYLGAGFWSHDVDLDDSFIFGGRAAYHFHRSFSVEGHFGHSSADRGIDGESTGLDHYGLDLVWDIESRAKITPYVLAGWGRLNFDDDFNPDNDTVDGTELGVGLKVRLSGDDAKYNALRIELRDVITNLNPWPYGKNSMHNMIATVGVQFAFGESSVDSDSDGVRDKDDLCANTPRGALVDATGCPSDSDGDGVYDGLDKCEGTPAGATVDSYGCPMDSDGDGVYDGLDNCPDTPEGATVDGNGCPMDSDGDGVYDGIDQCPDTAADLQVDQSGCPIAVTETEIQLLDTGRITTGNIVFASGSADIRLEDSAILQEIGETLSRWPELEMEILGHTDNTGSATFNQQLSQKRADSVLAYLKANYPDIDTTKYKATGMGEESPIADNETVEGRQANRRVEFKVLNPDELKREIEHRKLLKR